MTLVDIAAAIFLLLVPSDLAAAWSAINLKHTSMLWPALPQYAHFADLSVFSGETLITFKVIVWCGET